MIGFLEGTPHISEDKVIIVTHGVGYEVYVGKRVLRAATQLSSSVQETTATQKLSLFIHTHVREDVLELFGFQDEADKRLFLLLLNVSGIGPKTALLIADEGAAAITEAVQNANVSFFTKLPRVGKKVAQKIIIELKSKLGSLKELKIGGLSEEQQTIADAVMALGFDEQQVMEAIERTDLNELPLEAAIKAVLKDLQ